MRADTHLWSSGNIQSFLVAPVRRRPDWFCKASGSPISTGRYSVIFMRFHCQGRVMVSTKAVASSDHRAAFALRCHRCAARQRVSKSVCHSEFPIRLHFLRSRRPGLGPSNLFADAPRSITRRQSAVKKWGLRKPNGQRRSKWSPKSLPIAENSIVRQWQLLAARNWLTTKYKRHFTFP